LKGIGEEHGKAVKIFNEIIYYFDEKTQTLTLAKDNCIIRTA
jgi:hypothetical protein